VFVARGQGLCTAAAGRPEKIAGDPQFQRLIEGSFKSVATIERAIEARDQALLIGALREIRSSEQLLWMNFGWPGWCRRPLYCGPPQHIQNL